MLKLALPLTACLSLGTIAAAEVTTTLISEEDWALKRVDGYVFTMWDDVLEFDGICVAETVSGENRLQFAMFFREWRSIAPELIGLVMGQVLLPDRGLEPGPRDVVIRSGTSNYHVSGADLAPDRVSFMVEAAHTPASALRLVALMGDETIRLEDRDGTEIAAFSARGFAEVLDALTDCGGLEVP